MDTQKGMQQALERGRENLSSRTAPGRGALAFIYVTFFLDLLGATLLIPIQAYIVREYSASALAVSLLAGIYSAAQFIAAPILGSLSDRYGRRPVLLLSVLGSAIGYFMFGIGGALWVLFLSRLLDGITGGNLSTAQAYIADVTPPEQRAKNFGLMGAAFGLGFLLGPAFSGLLSGISLAAPAFAAGILSLASAIFGFFFLPESLPPQKRETGPFHWQQVNPAAVTAGIFKIPGLGLLLALAAFNLAFSGMTNNLPVYLIDRFSVQPGSVASLFVVVGLVNVLVQAGLVRLLAPKLGERKLAQAGLLLQAAAYAGMVIVPSFRALFPLAALMTTGSALTLPTLHTLVANRAAGGANGSEQGRAAGVSASMISLTNVFGPLWAGLAYDLISPGTPYLSGALILGAAWLLLRRMRA